MEQWLLVVVAFCWWRQVLCRTGDRALVAVAVAFCWWWQVLCRTGDRAVGVRVSFGLLDWAKPRCLLKAFILGSDLGCVWVLS